jgi:hypothetical protein
VKSIERKDRYSKSRFFRKTSRGCSSLGVRNDSMRTTWVWRDVLEVTLILPILREMWSVDGRRGTGSRRGGGWGFEGQRRGGRSGCACSPHSMRMFHLALRRWYIPRERSENHTAVDTTVADVPTRRWRARVDALLSRKARAARWAGKSRT